ncbi:aldehyde dehydrogenase [Salmonella enterica subsp. enterica]|nr:aldehyde dehydrogenase [Salmonella enterica subsp. enterica]
MNQQDIEQVVKAVLLKMKDSSQPASTVHEMGVFASLDDAVAAAKTCPAGAEERGDAPACHSCHSRGGRKTRPRISGTCRQRNRHGTR